MALGSKTFEFAELDEALEYYYSEGLTDGLPIVLPTESNVRAMLDYVGLDGSEIVAEEKIRGKKFVAEKVAINAVMAGCKPEHLSVVIAAVKGISEDAFNLHANSTSTNGVGILVIVSGKAASEAGINSGTGAMGHGTRANAVIGRALGLIKINLFGSVPGEMDKSTFGHPGDYSFCFAEADDVIPWEPLRVEKGFSEASSTVTVMATVAPLQATTYDYKLPEEFLTIASDAMLGLGRGHEEIVMVLSPEVLEYVRQSGWTKQQIKDFVFQKARRTGSEWNASYRPGRLFSGAELDAEFPVVESTDRITVVGAGGAAGGFISIIGSWGGISSITKEI